MTLLTVICVAMLFVVAFKTLPLCDSLIRHEFEHHHEQWIADGRPNGFFWRPPGEYSSDSSLARNRITRSWLFSTPEWVSSSPDMKRIFLQLRKWTLLGGAAWLVAVISFILGNF